MNLEPRRNQRQKRHLSRWGVFLLLGLFLLGSIAGAAYYLFEPEQKANVSPDRMVALDKMNIMIMGVDSREDDVGRSDTLMVATVDPTNEKISILSIPRDTRVKIAGHGYDKINHAFAFGGHDLSKKTVEDFLNIPIDHYIVIDMQAFKRIINAIGGVDINVEKPMHYEDPWDDEGGLVINLAPGLQHMDGDTAIEYVRFRDEEGDIGRIRRQQKFMRAVLKKLSSTDIITKLPGIIKEISSAVKTDLSIPKMLSLAGILKTAHENRLTTEMVSGTPLFIDDINYWIPNILKLRETLAQTLGIDITPQMTAIMRREDEEYKASLPQITSGPVSRDKPLSSPTNPKEVTPPAKISSNKTSDNKQPSTTKPNSPTEVTKTNEPTKPSVPPVQKIQ
jgi:LCP family protein required for cell wall assembly